LIFPGRVMKCSLDHYRDYESLLYGFTIIPG
jgi:hypothetical protein